MKDWIRRLSFQSEFTIVVLGAFGFALVGTVLALAAPDLVLHGAPPLTNACLLRTALFELVVGALLWQLVWFARKGRLGPLILAHALVDFLGLSLA